MIPLMPFKDLRLESIQWNRDKQEPWHCFFLFSFDVLNLKMAKGTNLQRFAICNGPTVSMPTQAQVGVLLMEGFFEMGLADNFSLMFSHSSSEWPGRDGGEKVLLERLQNNWILGT